MATSMLDFLNYDLSNTQLADAVKHARQTKAQTKANKAKWTNVASQVNQWGFLWNRGKQEEMYNTYNPKDFGQGYPALGSDILGKTIRNYLSVKTPP